MIALEYLFLWFLFYSFIGWIYESILVSATERRWVNRGFLNGPLCPIYGCGAVLAVVLLRDVHDSMAIFLVSSLGASVLEYVTSWGMERLFHARWWDYSNYRFNIHGRICLLGAVVSGFAGVLIVNVVHPAVAYATSVIPLPAVHAMCAVFAVAVIIDTIVTVLGMADLADNLAKLGDMVQSYAEKAGDSWQWGRDVFSEKVHGLSESSQELFAHAQTAVASVLNRQQRRMIAAFPHMRSTESAKYSKIIETVREMIRRRK